MDPATSGVSQVLWDWGLPRDHSFRNEMPFNDRDEAPCLVQKSAGVFARGGDGGTIVKGLAHAKRLVDVLRQIFGENPFQNKLSVEETDRSGMFVWNSANALQQGQDCVEHGIVCAIDYALWTSLSRKKILGVSESRVGLFNSITNQYCDLLRLHAATPSRRAAKASRECLSGPSSHCFLENTTGDTTTPCGKPASHAHCPT